jgi:hypothetical protein
MASANVTISDSGKEFEADGTERIATFLVPGLWTIYNRGNDAMTGVKAAINADGGAVVLTEPATAPNMPIPVGAQVQLPFTCKSFTFKANASTMLIASKS